MVEYFIPEPLVHELWKCYRFEGWKCTLQTFEQWHLQSMFDACWRRNEHSSANIYWNIGKCPFILKPEVSSILWFLKFLIWMNLKEDMLSTRWYGHWWSSILTKNLEAQTQDCSKFTYSFFVCIFSRIKVLHSSAGHAWIMQMLSLYKKLCSVQGSMVIDDS